MKDMLAAEAILDSLKSEIANINRTINYKVCLGELSATYCVEHLDDKLILKIISDLRTRGFVIKILQNPHWWNGYAFKLKISW